MHNIINNVMRTESLDGVELLVEQIDRQAMLDLLEHIKAGRWSGVTECEEYFTSETFIGFHANKEIDGSRFLTSILTKGARSDPEILKRLEPGGYMSQEVQQLTWRWDTRSKCIRSAGERFEIYFGKNIRPCLVDRAYGTSTKFQTVGHCTRSADATMRIERMARYNLIHKKIKEEKNERSKANS